MWSKKVQLAKKFAAKAHEGQKYGEEFPYVIHLQAVEGVGRRFGLVDDTFLCSFWLHDTLEDTSARYEELVALFGFEVAEIVAAVTEPKGMTRKERHAVTYPKIAAHPKALLVKLADRIAHLEAGGSKTSMYRKEHPMFVKMLGGDRADAGGPSVLVDMWDYLDELIAEAPYE